MKTLFKRRFTNTRFDSESMGASIAQNGLIYKFEKTIPENPTYM